MSIELRELLSRWAAVKSIAAKARCSSEALRSWVRQADRGTEGQSGSTTNDLGRLKELEHESKGLRRASEILRKASAYFAWADLDRRPS
jgi:transposase-like protein